MPIYRRRFTYHRQVEREVWVVQTSESERESKERERGREKQWRCWRENLGFELQPPRKTPLFHSPVPILFVRVVAVCLISCCSNFHSTPTISRFPVTPYRLVFLEKLHLSGFFCLYRRLIPRNFSLLSAKIPFSSFSQVTQGTNDRLNPFHLGCSRFSPRLLSYNNLSSSSSTRSAIIRLLDMSSLGFSSNLGEILF